MMIIVTIMIMVRTVKIEMIMIKKITMRNNANKPNNDNNRHNSTVLSTSHTNCFPFHSYFSAIRKIDPT